MIKLAYTSDHYRGYVGDRLLFTIVLTVLESVENIAIAVVLPVGMMAQQIDDLALRKLGEISYAYNADRSSIQWSLLQRVDQGVAVTIELEVSITAMPDAIKATQAEHPHEALAQTFSTVSCKPTLTGIELKPIVDNFSVVVSNASQYLNHIPTLFHHPRDEFLWRLLMVFESVWAPIDLQIENIANYLDADLTTARMLPQLANWMGFDFDETWLEAAQRKLLRPFTEGTETYPCLLYALYRRRGTKWALDQWLRLYTGKIPHIIERRANDFRLGKDSRLGIGIALGSHNIPQTFEVQLDLPPLDPSKRETDEYRAKQMRMIRKLIEFNTPAGIRYTLQA